MGQKFQTIVILPSIYMNERNPNNKSKRFLVFHNQWLYGYTALSLNLEIIKRIKEGINKRVKCGTYGKNKKGYINHYLQESVIRAVEFCSLKDIHNERKFHLCGEYEFKDYFNLGLELKQQDNNNGFFICEITEDLKIKYSFISGFEDEEVIRIKTPLEYLNLFYDNDKINTFEEKDKKIIFKIIKDYNRFKELNDNLKPVVDILNDSKPYQKYINTSKC